MILYFTGTGNSKFAAEYIGSVIGEEPVSINEFMKKEECPEFHSDSPYIITAPVYAWRLPHVVEDFIRKAEFCGNKEVFFVMTCGDSIGNAGAYNKVLCDKKEWTYRGTARIIMPENYIAMFNAPDLETSKRIIGASQRNIRKTAEYILQGGNLPKVKVTMKDRLLSGPINAGFNRYYVKANKFYAKESCTRCGLCEKLCPMNNIKVKNVKPVWGKKCTHCMACICSCPVSAIEYGKTSEGKVRYLCPDED